MEILTEKGKIVEVKGNKLKIEVPRREECDHCGSLFCSLKERNSAVIEVEATEGFKVGDSVEIQLPGKQLVWVTCLIYLFPLLILVASIYFGFEFTGNVLYSSLLAFTFVGIYFLVIRKLGFGNINPKIIRKLN
ncbi:MAG: SoxR reducing system RseC family protein [Candidatus Kapaibacteriota bacterium]